MRSSQRLTAASCTTARGCVRAPCCRGCRRSSLRDCGGTSSNDLPTSAISWRCPKDEGPKRVETADSAQAASERQHYYSEDLARSPPHRDCRAVVDLELPLRGTLRPQLRLQWWRACQLRGIRNAALGKLRALVRSTQHASGNVLPVTGFPTCADGWTPDSQPRMVFVDVLRVAVIVMVIVHHAAQAYGPTGGTWPVTDPRPSDWFRP